MTTHRALAALLAALVLGAAPAGAQQKNSPPQPMPGAQRTQQLLHQQMTAMQQEMQRLRVRIDRVDANLARSMEQTQDRVRIQEHQALRDACGGLGTMATEMERSAERLQEMARTRAFQDDPELRMETERLREQYRHMETELGESVRTLERMEKRLGQVWEDDG